MGGDTTYSDESAYEWVWVAMNAEFFFAEVTSDDAKVLIISVAARMAGMHPQTLRQYDRMGLVQPGRAPGGGRRYSIRDVALLREIQRLSQDAGVNLAGVKRVIELEELTYQLRQRLAEVEVELAAARQRLADLEALALPRRDLVRRGATPTALVVWKPPSNPRRS
jgi:MerR family transcriptional regulator/heat shock protein HspR